MTTSYPNITINQGETYYFPPFEIDGDWTGGVCRGQIRDQYLYLGGAVLAYFQFEDLTYDSVTEKTTVKPYIDHQFTSLIPPTKWRGTGDPSDRNAYVFDIEIEKGGGISKKSPGFVGIIPEVTDNSVVVDPPIIWDGSIDRIELTETNGLIKTYTVWGTPSETVNLGTFDVTDGQDGQDGVGIESVAYNESVNTITVTLTDGTVTETESLKGAKGDQGNAATISVGSVTTGNAGSNASVTNTGTNNNAVLEFTIPQGLKGDKGDGSTVQVGTVTTGNAGTNASVTNIGTSNNAILDFTIPQGIPGQDASAIETIHIHLSDKENPVVPAADVEWFFLDYNLTITSIRVFSLREAPVGSSIIIRVRNEATNLFTNLNTLTIPVGQTSAGPFVPDNAYHAEGSILWFDIQQVGSSSTGLDYRIILQGTRS